MLRTEWRDPTKPASSRRQWRLWHKRDARFERHLDALRAGACARGTGASSR